MSPRPVLTGRGDADVVVGFRGPGSPWEGRAKLFRFSREDGRGALESRGVPGAKEDRAYDDACCENDGHGHVGALVVGAEERHVSVLCGWEAGMAWVFKFGYAVSIRCAEDVETNIACAAVAGYHAWSCVVDRCSNCCARPSSCIPSIGILQQHLALSVCGSPF